MFKPPFIIELPEDESNSWSNNRQQIRSNRKSIKMIEKVVDENLAKTVEHLRKVVGYGFVSVLGITIVLSVGVACSMLTTPFDRFYRIAACVSGLTMCVGGIVMGGANWLTILWGHQREPIKSRIRHASGITAILLALLLAVFASTAFFNGSIDYFQRRLLMHGIIATCIVLMGGMVVDEVMKRRLTLCERFALYSGVILVLGGISFFGVKLHRHGEMETIRNAAEYHDTIMYHRAKAADAYDINRVKRGN